MVTSSSILSLFVTPDTSSSWKEKWTTWPHGQRNEYIQSLTKIGLVDCSPQLPQVTLKCVNLALFILTFSLCGAVRIALTMGVVI